MRCKRLLFLIVGLIPFFTMSSCVDYKKVPYFQNIPQADSTIAANHFTIPKAQYEDILIEPDNILNISVTTLDNVFNSNGINGQGGQQGQTQENSVAASTVSGYLVDKEGNISLPLLGTVHVAGLNSLQARNEVQRKADRFYKSPVVTLRIANFKIKVLGEVASPGLKFIPTERANILDVLAMAGDLTVDGMRTNVLILRDEGDHYESHRIDLTRTDFINSPYFYLKQGDNIYVQPNKNKASSTDNVFVRNYGLVLGALTTAMSLITFALYLKKN